MSMKRTFIRLAMGSALLAGAAVSAPAAHAADVRPIPELESLSVFVGTWDCTGATTTPDGGRIEFENASTVEFADGGKHLRWHEESSIGGIPIGTAEYVWGWDAKRKKFTVNATDSFGRTTVQKSRGWVGNSLPAKGRTTEQDGSSMPSRITLTTTSEESFTAKAVVYMRGHGGMRATGRPVVVSETSCTK